MISLSSPHLSPSHPTHLSTPTLFTVTKIKPLMAIASPQDTQSSGDKRVAVVGAGVSGLAAAFKLKSHGLKVTLFEADDRPGGRLKTVQKDGFIWDEGANTMTESELEVTNLIDDLGLRDKQQFPISQNKRYIARDGRPVLLPSNPFALIESNILSTKAKLQVLFEPFLWRKVNGKKVADDNTQESVGEFFERHFGKEFVDYLIDPFVAGTSAGDPQSLSMRHAFPELWDIENRFGSVIIGAIRSASASKRKSHSSSKKSKPRGSFSFSGGMQTLVDTICQHFGSDELKLGSKVLSLCYSHNGSFPSENWSVSSATKNTTVDQRYDAVVVTAPLSNVKEFKIVKQGIPYPLDFIPKVDYLPLSVVITAFKKSNVKIPLEGFGVLIPSMEQKNGLKTLGTLFSSMMFPDRAPPELHLYTTFVGGSRNRALAQASTDELKQIVSLDLQQLLGVEGEPTFLNHFYWSKAFPLYGRNYDSILRAIGQMEQDLPGFFYAGNHKDGLSVGKAIASGYKAADLVISYLGSNSDHKMVQDRS